MNENPIVTGKVSPTPTVFNIPEKFRAVMLYLTIKVELLDEGWSYTAASSVRLDLTQLYPLRSPEPVDLKLAHGANLDGKKLSTFSHVSRFRNGSETPEASRVAYKLMLEGGEELIDEFSFESDHKNPTDFFAFIQFKQL